MKKVASHLVYLFACVWIVSFAFPPALTAQTNGVPQQISALQARMTEAETRLTATESRLTLTESRLSAAETEVSTLTSQNSNYALRIVDLEAQTVPVGTIIAYSGEVPPAGYLECDGSEVSRADYPNLFAAIGTTFGQGDGFSTFRIPETRGVFLRGWSHGNGYDPDRASRVTIYPGGAFGDHVGSWQDHLFANHSHTTNFSFSNFFGPYQATVGSNGVGSYGVASSATGGNETRPRNVSVMYAVKY